VKQNNSVDEFLSIHPEWHDELNLLRKIILSTEMEETIKWGIPVYTVDGKNIVGIGAFKSYTGLWFYHGVFLEDKTNILVNAQEGKTKGMRQWRFTSIEEIDTALVREYLEEAITNQKAGKEVKPEKKPLILPRLLVDLISEDIAFAQRFEAMSLTLKREYADYISDAKREATKQSRLAKIKPMIMAGIGLNDKYR
jgi:uncharacterized protein YdeI (YjbR/CyaY-like superfamily)